MLDQNALTPLYEQLKNSITEDIKAKIYRPGDRMPSETELEQKYGVSRITVRRAVKELCEEEVLIRKQGKGTFVLNAGTKNRLDQLRGFHDAMGEQGKSVKTEILERSIIHVKESYAKDLQINRDNDVMYLKRVMYADDMPMMYDMCYLPMNRFPGIVDKLTGDFSIFRVLRDEYELNPEDYYKVIKVRKATKEVAGFLQCTVGDPLFDIFKITYNEEKIPLFISISLIKGENTSYVIASDTEDHLNHIGVRWGV
ncbi:UTRA domain-containing protein [Blautia liquoris]|uniref:UTRA domain-containing protein n=1 Tax=Blautia liquoris TaxID=2779518 RepID=A0A7M2RHV5_9FIRM|nr:UTRA domain-containing protein [Blautia liquoris]QOV19127.1 UTRA domain-containing protein [Blautia liquoris]